MKRWWEASEGIRFLLWVIGAIVVWVIVLVLILP
jgi:hypothetical protein